MADASADHRDLVGLTANRLRLIQLDFAHEPLETRQAYIAEELARATEKLAPGKKTDFLEALAVRFPTWDGQVRVQAERPESVESEVDARELSDASFLVTRLIEVSKGLSESERQVIRDRMAAAGLAPVGAASGPAWRDDQEERLRKIIGGGADAELDAERGQSLVDLLVASVTDLDKAVWETWREVAPKERLSGRNMLRQNLGRFLGGDEDVSRDQVTQDLERLRRMFASMILAMRRAPREWARRHVETISPLAVERLVDFEGIKLIQNRDVQCWRKYKELAAGLDELAMSTEILQAIARHAGQLVEGR